MNSQIMKEKRGVKGTGLILSFLCFVACILTFNISQAEVLGPGWYNLQPESITPTEAASIFKNESRHMRVASDVSLRSVVVDDRITELARALQHNPLLIFQYVHDHIDYEPYYGALKGSALTLLDGSGNDCDQAALFISLLRASGVSADFVYGTMTIPNDQLSNWLGVDNNTARIVTAIERGAIPHVPPGTSDVTLTRVWVQFTVDEVVYDVDPAFKSYEEYVPLNNLGTVLEYSKNDILNSVGGNSSSILQNLNEAGLISKLKQYTNELMGEIKNNYPNSTINQVFGGRAIIPLVQEINYSDINIPTSTPSHKF